MKRLIESGPFTTKNGPCWDALDASDTHMAGEARRKRDELRAKMLPGGDPAIREDCVARVAVVRRRLERGSPMGELAFLGDAAARQIVFGVRNDAAGGPELADIL